MTRITIIQSVEESDWVSCKTIRTNILKAYERVAQKSSYHIDVCRIKKNISEFEIYKRAVQIVKDQPKKVVFIDHNPKHLKIIRSFARLKQEDGSFDPQLIFHIYGDFLIQAKDWLSIGKSLCSFDVKFITSSTKQKQLVEKCLNLNQKATVLPFPVNFDEFYYDSKLRRNERLRLGLNDSDFVFVYSGRLSQQKNDLELLRSFLFMRKHMAKNIKIIFAGPFDDLGLPYFGYYSGPGAHYFEFHETLKAFPENISQDVTYLGNLNKEGLNSLLNASDCFASLSAHNDEDYGMAVAEAGATGLKMVLSAWGGYLDLGASNSKHNHFVPLKLEKMIRPLETRLIKGLALTMRSQLEDNERESISKKAQGQYSIEAVAAQLSCLLEESDQAFQGFSELFHEVSSVIRLNPSSPFSSTNGKVSYLFKTLYLDYGNIEDSSVQGKE